MINRNSKLREVRKRQKLAVCAKKAGQFRLGTLASLKGKEFGGKQRLLASEALELGRP